MKKLLVILALFLFGTSNIFAYSIKVYDEYGNRVGTYRKEGDHYQFYDFNDNKVDRPEDVIESAPTDKTLTEYSQTFYDENMMPIGIWRSGFYSNDGRYYPRGYFYPTPFSRHCNPHIIRPNAKKTLNRGIYYEDSRYYKMREYKK